MPKCLGFLFRLMLIVLFSGFNLPAYSAQTDDHAAQIKHLLTPKMTLESSWYESAKFKNSEGHLGGQYSQISLSNFLLTATYERYQFVGRSFVQSTTTQEPIKTIESYQLDVKLPYRWDANNLILGNLKLINAFEKESHNALTFQGYLLWSQTLNPLNSWQIGAYYTHHSVEDLWLPIIEYTHNYHEVNRQGFYGHFGFPKTQLGYQFSPKFHSDIGAVYQQVIGRLADDSEIFKKGYFQLSSWRGEWANYYRYSKTLEFKLALKWTLDNKIQMFDQHYTKHESLSLLTAKGIGIGLEYRFE